MRIIRSIREPAPTHSLLNLLQSGRHFEAINTFWDMWGQKCLFYIKEFICVSICDPLCDSSAWVKWEISLYFIGGKRRPLGPWWETNILLNTHIFNLLTWQSLVENCCYFLQGPSIKIILTWKISSQADRLKSVHWLMYMSWWLCTDIFQYGFKLF